VSTFNIMFDIKDHYPEGTLYGTDDVRSAISDIEEDISLDIDNLLRNRFDSLYLRDKFKHPRGSIDILYPRVSCPWNRAHQKNPDAVRNLLSLYPNKTDFENISRVVLRPRHVHLGDVELMALYIRSMKTIVYYLHRAHSYAIQNSRFREYAELAPADNARALSGGPDGNTGKNNAGATVPPLWYVMSLCSSSEESTIDKFFVRNLPGGGRAEIMQLDEISFFYSRHGY
jgi:hypothetical protein